MNSGFRFFLGVSGRLLFLLSMVFFVPSFLFVAFGLSSLAPGLILVAIITLPRLLVGSCSLGACLGVRWLFLSFVGFLSVYLVVGVLTTPEWKPLFSFVALITLFFLSTTLAQLFLKLPFDVLIRTMLGLLLFLILLGWTSQVLDVKLFGFDQAPKAVFPFSEQSHYALAVGMVSVAIVSISAPWVAGLIVLNLFLLSFVLPSLTMLLFAIIALVVMAFRLRPIFALFLLFVLGSVFGVGLASLLGNVEYFASRLDFRNLDNLTLLVWIQGWELAVTNFLATSGFGIGFQGLGGPSTRLSEISFAIYDRYGAMFNIDDGGFLAAKLIAEFGVVAVVLSFLYLIAICYLLLTRNRKSKLIGKADGQSSEVLKKEVVMNSLVLSFSVEYFFRGYGYFSPGVVVFLSAIISIVAIGFRYRDQRRYLL